MFNQKELKKYLEEVHEIGRKLGAVQMQGKIIKILGEDEDLIKTPEDLAVMIKILLKIKNIEL